MNEEVNMIIDMTRESMEAAVNHLDYELVHIRAGKANPRMLDSVGKRCRFVASNSIST